MQSQDLRFSSPAALRNRGPIFDLLHDVLPDVGTVLEIASGSGEHIIHFAARLPGLVWQPSDPSPDARASIQEWVNVEALTNVLPPRDIDASSENWPIDPVDAIISINMVHISPWSATQGLLKGARKHLTTGGSLILYGPYRREGHALAESNADFDADLRSRNPAWGIRTLEDVVRTAEPVGLAITSVVEMPANNLGVVFRRL